MTPTPVPLAADVVRALSAAVEAGMPRARRDLTELVGCRSVFDPAVEPVEECHRAADLTQDFLAECGLTLESVQAPDGSRVVVGRGDGPPGTPTVLLYSHHDVQPAGPLEPWSSPPFELTERDGRWYGRGTADCKGNLVAHLVALRAVREVLGSWPVSVVALVEGSEEQSTIGLIDLVPTRPDLVTADIVVIADVGNIAVGVPTVTTSLRGTGSVVVTVSTLRAPVHSGSYGGAAPDALHALMVALTSLRDASGRTVIDGLEDAPRWTGAPYRVDQVRADAGVLDGVSVLGDDGHGSVANAVWAQPSVSVLAIDAPRVEGAVGAIVASATALVGLRVPPGMSAGHAQERLIEHLHRHTPWGAQVTVTPVSHGEPYQGRVDGPGYAALATAMEQAYGAPVQRIGDGGSIPFAAAVAAVHPEVEILLIGVEEPLAGIHGPDESVDPEEIRRTALAEAIFLAGLGAST